MGIFKRNKLKNIKPLKSKTLNKSDYGEEWPFKSEYVTIENHFRYFILVDIEGKKYALNGLAVDKFKIPHVHDKGLTLDDPTYKVDGSKMAKKPVTKFIEIGLNL